MIYGLFNGITILSGKWNDSLEPNTDRSTLDSISLGGTLSPSLDFLTEPNSALLILLFSSSYSELDYLTITLTFLYNKNGIP